jgi:uncharacterized membrane protein YGL010W
LEKKEMRFGPFLAISVLLLFVWFSAFLMFHIAAGLLDLVLVLALASFIAHFFTGRRPAPARRPRLL